MEKFEFVNKLTFRRQKLFVQDYLCDRFYHVSYDSVERRFYVMTNRLSNLSLKWFLYLSDLGLKVVCRPNGEFIETYIYL